MPKGDYDLNLGPIQVGANLNFWVCFNPCSTALQPLIRVLYPRQLFGLVIYQVRPRFIASFLVFRMHGESQTDTGADEARPNRYSLPIIGILGSKIVDGLGG